MGRILIFGRNLFTDGYKLVGWSASILTILFPLAKWLGWSVIIDLQELSYAWAFAPITIWFFIAYWRRWVKYQNLQEERDRLQEIKDYETALDELSKKFDHGNNKILNAAIQSDVEFGKWKAEWEIWGNEVQDFLETHLGLRERNLFKNVVLFEQIPFADHAKERSIVARQLEMLRDTIVRYSDRVQKWRAENI